MLIALVSVVLCACDKNGSYIATSGHSSVESGSNIITRNVSDAGFSWEDSGFSLDGYVPNALGEYTYSLSTICHILIFYNLGSTDIRTFPSGDLALDVLLDEGQAIKLFGQSPFIRTNNGLRYVLNDDPFLKSRNGELHRDQCLCTLAKLDIPRETPIYMYNGDVLSVDDLLNEAIASYDLMQKEPAWTTIALAHYLPPVSSWKNKFNEVTTFSRLVDYLISLSMDGQSCAGTHLLQALIHIHNSNRISSILDNRMSVKLENYLFEIVGDIYEHQNEDGSWGWVWCHNIKKNPNMQTISDRDIKLLVTGHLLECLVDLSNTCELKKEQVMHAVNWFVSNYQEREVGNKSDLLCPYTHAAMSAGLLIQYYNYNNLQ